MSSNYVCHVAQFPDTAEPAHVESPVVHAPLSPPPTLKKVTSPFPKDPIENPSSQERSRKCNLTPDILSKRTRRVQFSVLYIVVTLLGLFCWWRSGYIQDLESLKQRASHLTKDFLLPTALDGLHFIPATNPNFHYVGRWTYTPNRLRRDSNFPGAYLEFRVRNCSTAFAALHNTDIERTTQELALEGRSISEDIHLDFRPVSERARNAPPVSLISQIDNKEHETFWRSAKGLVAVAVGDLDASADHLIRLIATGTEHEEHGGLQFEGVWLNVGGALTSWHIQPTIPEVAPGAGALLPKKSAKLSQSKMEMSGLQDTTVGGVSDKVSPYLPLGHRKTVEMVSDVPRSRRSPVENGSLAAVKGFEDLVGDMFAVDHVSISMEGMCLTSPCIGATKQAASVREAYFRSGPPGTPSFSRSWNFRSYIPEAVVLVLGNSDAVSFGKYQKEYEKTVQELQREFEEVYIKFVRAIRRVAYPLHPAAFQDYSSNADGYVYNSAPATIPIFVVVPFTGAMQFSTQKVVEKLQSEGDKAVYWLDTSGWFSAEDFESDPDSDSTGEKRLLLTSQGNRKAAAFLHAHLCHYLADDPTQCPFQKHEAYTGRVYVPRDAELEKLMEESKVRKLKGIVWPENREESE